MPSAKTIGNRLAPPRYLLFVFILALGWGVGISALGWQQGVMIGFDVAALAFLISCISLFNDGPKEMRADAKANDANRVMLLGLSFVISLVILVAVGSQLSQKGVLSAFEIALIVSTLVLAWTFVNSIYALHYAHLYYSGDDGGSDTTGLDFPGKRPPIMPISVTSPSLWGWRCKPPTCASLRPIFAAWSRSTASSPSSSTSACWR